MTWTNGGGQGRPLLPFFRITLRAWVKAFRSVIAAARPLADMLIRLAIAQYFLRSGLVKIGNWDSALALAKYEYPVSWMEPQTAALVGVSIELGGPVLLAAGLLSRPAAFAMAALLAVSQAVYLPTTTNLFLIALLGWYVWNGAGALSLDRAVAAGFARSALPLAKTICDAASWCTARVAPVWLMALRIWLAVSLAVAAGWAEPPVWLATWLAPVQFAGVPFALAALLAALLVSGLFTWLAALLLALSAGTMAVMGLHPDIVLYPMLSFLLLGLWGGGAPGADGLISGWLERNVLFDRPASTPPADWPHVVVVGGGFGGLACVNALKRLPLRITLIDRYNYHLFQPLLYQVATAALSPADVATPIRSLFRSDGNVRVLLGEVDGVAPDDGTVSFAGSRLGYDWLVLATGASHSYFGRDEWAPHAPGLKRIEDGTSVRARVLGAFEKAEAESDPERIERLLTFVIVGAGPTGVELAGAIAELARFGLRNEYRNIDPARARIVLVQSGDRILPAFPEELSRHAQQSLEGLGVEIRLDSRVTEIAACHVRIGEEGRIASETVLWAAGVVASPAGSWLGASADAAGRVAVDGHLRVEGHERIFAIGDTAASMGWDGRPVPGLAPAAKQAGAYVSRFIRAQLQGAPLPRPFAYRHQGSLATIGRKSAVADFGWMQLHGALAWWLWGAVHVGFLVGVRNRAAVILNWGWSYFTQRLGIRLITGRG